MCAMAAKRVKLSAQIRQTVDESGMSRYAICKATGIHQAAMSRFMAGTVGLSMANLDALADLLEIDVTARGRKPRRKAR